MNKKKGIVYTSGGIGHSDESFKELIEKNIDSISKMVNVEERIAFIKKQKKDKEEPICILHDEVYRKIQNGELLIVDKDGYPQDYCIDKMNNSQYILNIQN